MADLVARDVISLSTSPYRYYLPNGHAFSKLEIANDGIISRFTAGAIGGKEYLQKYCVLETNIEGGDTERECPKTR